MNQILISFGKTTLKADLFETPTARAIWDALPIDGRANTWGDEIYFSIPVAIETEAGARAAVAVGELGYWGPGSAFCAFFGPTPASDGDEPRAASPVNVFGKILGDATALRAVRDGDKIRLARADAAWV